MKVLAPRLDASPAGRERLPNLAAAPTSPAVGEIYFDTTTNKAYVCTNATGPVWSDITVQQSNTTPTTADWKDSVRVATVGTETFTISTAPVSVTQINGTAIDGVTLAIGDRILVKDAPSATGVGSAGSSQPGNGIYRVTANTTNLTVARDADADAATGELTAAVRVGVSEGSVNAASVWAVITSDPITVGTTAIQFSSRVRAELGAVGAPPYTFVGNTTTGMFSPAANTLAFTTGGVNRLQVNSDGTVTLPSSSLGSPVVSSRAFAMAV